MFLVSSISSKKTYKNKSTTMSISKVEFVHSFFGRNVNLKKSFRLCLTFNSSCIKPFFLFFSALVKESVTIEDLTRKIKGRVLTVNEVGHAFDLSLKIDQTGACYVVFPDCPPFPMPNPNMPTLGAMIAFGKYFGGPLSLETFNGKHVILAAVLILLFLYMVLCIIF